VGVKRAVQAVRSFSPSRYFKGTKFIGAGALIFDRDGRVLLIKNRLRNHWEYPAGGANGNESPLETCAREVAEEVGLALSNYHLIGIDFWRSVTPYGNLLFTFAATVTEAQVAQVKPQALEVVEWRWVSRDDAVELVAKRLRPRLLELFAAYDADKPIYLHSGEPVI
jgi:8-oxo-dGTP pyrophosphatase MutT (NUDIX family)